MILHPGIFALFIGSFISVMIMLFACLVTLKILKKWNINSSSEGQLLLERKTWLISLLLNYSFSFQIVSAFLFIFTAEEIHSLFIGAMCATGTLNANLIGWLVLLLKGGLLFAGGFWILLNQVDQNTEDTPLVRMKYRVLLVITPLVLLDLYLQWRFFSGLQPEVITSCCGSLFSNQGGSVAADLAGMPAQQAVVLFATCSVFYLFVLLICYFYKASIWRHLLFVSTLIMFFVALGSIVSFLSLYIYQMPSHHCPFDMLQANYSYVGYPMYVGLFVATLFGMAPGFYQPLRFYPSIDREIARRERRWLLYSAIGYLLFVIFPLWQMAFGAFRLFGY